MFYDLPLWVMGLMLLAVIGLIVLLIYLRRKRTGTKDPHGIQAKQHGRASSIE